MLTPLLRSSRQALSVDTSLAKEVDDPLWAPAYRDLSPPSRGTNVGRVPVHSKSHADDLS